MRPTLFPLELHPRFLGTNYLEVENRLIFEVVEGFQSCLNTCLLGDVSPSGCFRVRRKITHRLHHAWLSRFYSSAELIFAVASWAGLLLVRGVD